MAIRNRIPPDRSRLALKLRSLQDSGLSLEARRAVMDALIAEMNAALPGDRSEELAGWIREELERMDKERMTAAHAAAKKAGELEEDPEIAIGPTGSYSVN